MLCLGALTVFARVLSFDFVEIISFFLIFFFGDLLRVYLLEGVFVFRIDFSWMLDSAAYFDNSLFDVLFSIFLY